MMSPNNLTCKHMLLVLFELAVLFAEGVAARPAFKESVRLGIESGGQYISENKENIGL